MLPRSSKRVKVVIRNYHFWVILGLLVLCTIHHYPDQVGFYTALPLDSLFGLTRHAVDRVFYLVPIIYAGYIFGAAIGLATTSVALLLMLPRALFISPSPTDALFEIAIVILVGLLANFWFRMQAKQVGVTEQREQAVKAMVTAQEKLRTQIRNTMKYENELTALSSLSSSLVQSPTMKQSLRFAIDVVMKVMEVEVALIFSLEEETNELVHMAYEGVPWEFAQSVDRVRLGESFNGRVAETGEPLVVGDTSEDPGLSSGELSWENLQSQLIVPLKSGGRVVGTVWVGTLQHRGFGVEEIKLLTAMGNEIGIAIDNVHLHREQLIITEQLRQSEKHYRELFENAHDAIWVHDLEGNIMSANKATVMLL